MFTPSLYSNRFTHYGPLYGYNPILGNNRLTQFSGTSNWSDFDSSLKANDSIVGFDVRYFPSGGSPNPNVKGFGLFVIGGYSYEYLKFIVNGSSGSQLSSGKIYLGYLNGESISYSNSINEIKYGIGTQTNFQRWGLEVSFLRKSNLETFIGIEPLLFWNPLMGKDGLIRSNLTINFQKI